jgi:lipopolysaccharide transport system ATP-binding protein
MLSNGSSDGPSRPATPAIRAEALSKCYQLYDRPADRLRQGLWGRVLGRRYYREFWALHDVSLEVAPGEVLGIVGRNGAGKSTLLQLVCGTLTPTSGSIETRGRIAALLELGAGFNPEFSGRENVYMAASILGLTGPEIDERYEDIVEFSGVRDFIEQPVKTYSSGMYVRLAFSVATCVDPDILVIDEALSVGDGEFARKSFDRIMALKEAGKTILFCSHATYYIEAMCTRALWLRDGRAEMVDVPGRVVAAYGAFLESGRVQGASAPSVHSLAAAPATPPAGTARITGVAVRADGRAGTRLALRSGKSTLEITMSFASDPALPAPSIGVGIIHSSGIVVASAGSVNDGFVIGRDGRGNGEATLVFPSLPLLKGEYTLNLFLFCERGLHMYDYALCYAGFEVSQRDLEQGLVSLPHRWRNG